MMAEFQLDWERVCDEWAAELIWRLGEVEPREVAKQIRQQVQQVTLREVGEWLREAQDAYKVPTRYLPMLLSALEKGEMPGKEVSC